MAPSLYMTLEVPEKHIKRPKTYVNIMMMSIYSIAKEHISAKMNKQ